MSETEKREPMVVIACGGSGGHFYPGLAVANRLYEAGCSITLIVTKKEIDQVTTGAIRDARVERLPAVGLTKGHVLSFFTQFLKSYFIAKRLFAKLHPRVVLGMGGFSSAPPVLAAPLGKCKSFIHEGNLIPGRANRLIAPFVHTIFVHFPQSVNKLHGNRIEVTGMPVRDSFVEADATITQGYRMALGLDPKAPTLLVMGGSQGASAINRLMCDSIKGIQKRIRNIQVIHLTGKNDYSSVKYAYEKSHVQAVVHPYFTEMEIVMGAATAMVSRSGASSLAEIAAVGVPSILIPYPSAADNHQFYNAHAFEESGAAILLEQKQANVESFSDKICSLLSDEEQRMTIKRALFEWREKNAATEVAKRIIEVAMPNEGLRIDMGGEPVL